MKVAITGATGFVGTHLLQEFKDNVLIHRNDTLEEIVQKLRDVEIVINLAGAPIIKRWTPEYKKILISSRINTTKKIVNAINQSDVKLFISTSAIGAYPDNGTFDESYTEYSNDFLGTLTKEWEAEAKKCNKPTAIVRFGIVLGGDGGALSQMLPPFKMGVGGTIGDGSMMMSWVDIDDLVRVYGFIAKNQLSGVFNVTAPNPVTNYEFTKTLGRVLHRPTILPLPEFVLKLICGEAASVLIGSKEVYPKALLENGFNFQYPTIEDSLKHLLV
jgi:hypothetical protein